MSDVLSLDECLNPAITPDADWPELSRDFYNSEFAKVIDTELISKQ